MGIIGFYLIIAVCLLIIVTIYIAWIRPISNQRNYYMIEMKRATRESEYDYWKSKLNDLYIGSIPIVGKKILAERKRKRRESRARHEKYHEHSEHHSRHEY